MCIGPNVRLNPMSIRRKCDLPETLAQQPPEHLGPPVVHPAEQPEHRPAEDHVVEVRDDVVRVRLLVVGRHDRVRDAGEAADHEHRHGPDREEHRRGEPDITPVHRAHPVEDLHAGRDRDDRGRDPERGIRHRSETRREHVVRPDAEPDEPDRDPREHHELVAEQWLATEDRQDLARRSRTRAGRGCRPRGVRTARTGAATGSDPRPPSDRRSGSRTPGRTAAGTGPR